MKTDSELQRDVLDELKWEPSVDAAHIGVSVKDGIVTLTGHVASYCGEVRGRAGGQARLRRPSRRQRTRRQAARQQPAHRRGHRRGGRQRPQDQPLRAGDKIKVTVSKGWVKLEGEVEWQYQKDAAERAVRYLAGVTGVSNLITVKPRVVPTELKAKIEDAFKRSAELDATPHHGRGGRQQGDPARHRALAGRERGGRACGLVGSGGLQRREPHHRRTVMSCRDGGDPMSATGLDVFDTTVQKTNIWLNDLMKVAPGWQDRHKAYLASRATLQLRLATGSPWTKWAHSWPAQLPMLMRGFYYEGWDPSHKPLRECHRSSFWPASSRSSKAMTASILSSSQVSLHHARNACYRGRDRGRQARLTGRGA